MYIYETVLEVHYIHTNHTGPRPLTYDVFILSILSYLVKKHVCL